MSGRFHLRPALLLVTFTLVSSAPISAQVAQAAMSQSATDVVIQAAFPSPSPVPQEGEGDDIDGSSAVIGAILGLLAGLGVAGAGVGVSARRDQLRTRSEMERWHYKEVRRMDEELEGYRWGHAELVKMSMRQKLTRIEEELDADA